MTSTTWQKVIPDALVPIEANQKYDTATDIYDDANDSYDGSFPNGYQVVWTITTS
jgi:hypothetical protein